MQLSYGQFLLIFVISPTILLLISILSESKATRKELGWVLVIAFIAFVWTPIWDNYLVANKVWWYDPDLVWNIIIGWVPLEEYCFFVLQPLFGGIYFIYCYRNYWMNNNGNININIIKNGVEIKIISILIIGLIWSVSIYYFLYFDGNSDYDNFKYFMLIIIWSLPPLMIQLLFAADILFKYKELLSFVIISSTLYLSLTDCIAIYIGIWTISESKSIGNIVPGILPFEESFFFFITNILCVFGVSFYILPESKDRINTIIEYFSSSKQNKQTKSE